MTGRWLVVSPGADFSVVDVFHGVTDALARADHEIVLYELSGRLDQAGSWLKHLYERRKRRDPTVEQFTQGDVLYQAISGVFERALRFQPDVILIVSGMWFPPDALLLLRRAGFFVATLLTESPYDDEPQAKMAALSSMVWTTERDSLAYLRAANPRTHYLRHAFDPTRHYPGIQVVDEGDVPAHDVVFVGTGFTERIELLSVVDWSGIDFGLYGNWTMLGSRHRLRKYVKGGPIKNTKAAALYRNAKIGLNLYRTSMGWAKDAPRIEGAASLNPRAYELAACGCFHVSNERAEVRETFGDLVPTFDTPDQLGSILRSFLADDGARADIAHRLPGAVSGHTFDARVEQMVRQIDCARVGV